MKTTIFMVGYVADSTDGMSLFSTAMPFLSYEEADKYARNQVDNCTGLLDYVKDIRIDYDYDEDKLVEREDDDLPDLYNGGECCGYWVIVEGGL